MPQPHSPETGAEVAESYRIDVKLHDDLMDPSKKRSILVPDGPELMLPEPVFPQQEYSEESDATLTEYQRLNARRTWRAWGRPYFQSRSLENRKELRPIIAYLFTEFKCNLSCHYCWAFDNRIKGISEDVARRSIDWLHSLGNRVLALMGGRSAPSAPFGPQDHGLRGQEGLLRLRADQRPFDAS